MLDVVCIMDGYYKKGRRRRRRSIPKNLSESQAPGYRSVTSNMATISQSSQVSTGVANAVGAVSADNLGLIGAPVSPHPQTCQPILPGQQFWSSPPIYQSLQPVAHLLL